jgi:hypothetical protein
MVLDISRCQFEWFVTLTFQYSVTSYIARECFLQWVRSICVQEHLQIAAIIIYNGFNQGHLHVMMLGRNQKGKSLSDVSMEYWQKQWSRYKYGCLIEPIDNREGAAKNMNLYRDDDDNVTFYNKKLLKKAA